MHPSVAGRHALLNCGNVPWENAAQNFWRDLWRFVCVAILNGTSFELQVEMEQFGSGTCTGECYVRLARPAEERAAEEKGAAVHGTGIRSGSALIVILAAPQTWPRQMELVAPSVWGRWVQIDPSWPDLGTGWPPKRGLLVVPDL